MACEFWNSLTDKLHNLSKQELKAKLHNVLLQTLTEADNCIKLTELITKMSWKRLSLIIFAFADIYSFFFRCVRLFNFLTYLFVVAWIFVFLSFIETILSISVL